MRKSHYRLGAMLTLLLAIGLVVSAPASAWAQDAESRARSIVEGNTKAIMFCAHPTANFKSISKIVKGPVTGQADHFYLNYQYTWVSPVSGDTNTTEILFFFNKFGNIYATKGGDTTSFFRPFDGANAAIKTFGDELIRQVDQSGTDADKQLVRTLVQNSDASGLLSMSLRLQQR